MIADHESCAAMTAMIRTALARPLLGCDVTSRCPWRLELEVNERNPVPARTTPAISSDFRNLTLADLITGALALFAVLFFALAG